MGDTSTTQSICSIMVKLGRDTGYFQDKISHYDYMVKCIAECRANGIIISPQLEDEWIFGSPESDHIYNLALTYYQYKEIDPDISIEDVQKLMSNGPS